MNKRQRKKVRYWKQRVRESDDQAIEYFGRVAELTVYNTELTKELTYTDEKLQRVVGLNVALQKELKHWKERSSGVGSNEALVSYHIEDSNYSVEPRSLRSPRPTDVHIVHKLRVNAPLCIDHHGPLTENDALYLADTLAKAVHTAVLMQLEGSILGGRNAPTI